MSTSTSIPKLTEKQIEDWVGSKSFEKELVSRWIREAISALKDDYHDWSREEYNDFLNMLEKRENNIK